MPNYPPVATQDDLATLDEAEIVQGYLDFRRGDPEPGANRGRSYWHGWRNAAIDHGQIKKDDAAAALAHDVAPRRRAAGAARHA